MNAESSTPPYQVVTHGQILHEIRELQRNVRTNGRKMDILIDHLGAGEDWKIIAATERLHESSDQLRDAINSQSTPTPTPTQKETNAITNP